MKWYIFPLALLLASCAASESEIIVEKGSPVVQGKLLTENIGIETFGGILTPLLVSGCKLPCELSQIFSTAEDNQNQITISLVRGSSQLASEGVNLGRYKVSGIAAAPRGTPKIKVLFKASGGNIWLSAADTEGKSNIKLIKEE